MASKQGTADSWTDSLGQVFKPGDVVAVATVNNKSPQMVFGVVERINTTTPNGTPHTRRVWSGKKTPRVVRHSKYVGPPMREYSPMPGSSRSEWWSEAQSNPDNWETLEEFTVYDRELIEVQGATVTVRPLANGRGFSRDAVDDNGETIHENRYENDDDIPVGKHKAVTYTYIGNIVKLSSEMTEEEVVKRSRRAAEY